MANIELTDLVPRALESTDVAVVLDDSDETQLAIFPAVAVVLKDWTIGPALPFEITDGLALTSLDGVQVEFEITATSGAGALNVGYMIPRLAGNVATTNINRRTSMSTSITAGETVNIGTTVANFLFLYPAVGAMIASSGVMTFAGGASGANFYCVAHGSADYTAGAEANVAQSCIDYLLSTTSATAATEIWIADDFALINSVRYRVLDVST